MLKDGVFPDQLQTYEELHYVAVDEDELAKMDYSPTYATPFYSYPPYGPGYLPAARVSSGIPAYRVEEESNLPEDTVALKPGARVLSSDDHQVGNVEQIFTESTTQEATHFLVTKGTLFSERKLIPLAWVEQICEDEVHLTISSHQLEHLPEYKSDQA